MKMRLRILLLFLLTIVLLVSFTGIDDKNGVSWNTSNSVGTDTSNVRTRIKVNPFDLRILPPSSGVQFYRDGIVYLSSSKFEGKMISDQISFWKADARYAVLKDSLIENQQVFSPSLSFPYPCEAITFSGDYNTMYFTKYSKSYGFEKIYKAKLTQGNGNQGVWSVEENPVNFCADKYIYSHPALSPDGKFMIFASNRPGSVGGMDLYASQEKGGIWSEPVNLGDAVNSTSNELFPFLDSENNLFFSSDGSQGYGGYDVYVCRFKSNTWEKPINLGIPINTRSDDIAFTINRKDGKSAFYTVKQNSGERSSQLYKVKFESNNSDTLLTLSQFFTKPDISRMVILVLEPPVQATDRKSETAESKISNSPGNKDIVTYRVQFLTSFNPRTRSQISVNGKDYSVFEFLYSGAYRLCLGEFSTLSPAIDLQNLLKQNNYPNASVLAFKNNVLSLDPELLKEQVVSAALPPSEKPKISEPVTMDKSSDKVAGNLNKAGIEARKADSVKTTVPGPEIKKGVTVPASTTQPAEKKDIVVYRIQIMSNSTSKGTFKITVSGKIYNTFEYFYAGAYRSTVGEFSTLVSAAEFQKTVRQSGYPQAFVVAFKNNVRSADPSLFK